MTGVYAARPTEAQYRAGDSNGNGRIDSIPLWGGRLRGLPLRLGPVGRIPRDPSFADRLEEGNQISVRVLNGEIASPPRLIGHGSVPMNDPQRLEGPI